MVHLVLIWREKNGTFSFDYFTKYYIQQYKNKK